MTPSPSSSSVFPPASAVILMTLAFTAFTPGTTSAQPIGTFRWQVQPYCNVVTVALTQTGGIFRLEGTDDRCGAGGTAASVIGTAFFNANGTIGLGLNIAAPGSEATQIDATVTLPSANGTWRDTAGHSGAFVLTPGGGTGGALRPAAGPVGAASVDAAQVQLRVTGACPAGQYMQSVGQGGAVTCGAVAGSAGGTITSVAPGAGLVGGGTSGAVSIGLPTTAEGALNLSGINGIVATGTQGSGAQMPVLPYGPAMVWNPRQAAFRVGNAVPGAWDGANVGYASVAMGSNTRASADFSVALGTGASASGNGAVALGTAQATGDRSVAIGYSATAAGFLAVALGDSTALGPSSMTFGQGARTSAGAGGSIVFGDTSGTGTVESTVPNQFLVRAAGGVVFWSSPDTTYPTGPGVALYSGAGGWSGLSDVNAKENFRDLAGETVLQKIAQIPVREWNYKAQDAAIRHMGPTAQDFYAAFGLGEDEHRINSIDADGVALAAVRALEARTRALQDENTNLRNRLERLERLLEKTGGVR